MTSLLEQLDSSAGRIVDNVRSAAGQLGVEAWLVGGPVRDLLLGRAPLDVDFALSGDTERVATRVAASLEGTVETFPRFLTCKVTTADGVEIDLATMRRETYPAPGALPDVAPGTPAEDSARRDFTINSMALHLFSGALHDPFGGRKDLQANYLRILHPRSFVDDPTRVFRCFRFARRLRFHPEGETAELLSMAIDAGAISTLSAERVWRELLVTLKEKEAGSILIDLAESGALERFLEIDRVVDSVDRNRFLALDHYAGAERERSLAALVLLRKLSREPAGWQSGSGMKADRLRRIELAAGSLDEFLARLSSAVTGREQLKTLESGSAEHHAVALTTDNRLGSLVDRYRGCMSGPTGVRGDQLGVPPGRHVGRALEDVRAALFLGELTVAEAPGFASRRALEYLEGAKAGEER